MNEELHINPSVSALVMLAAIIATYNIYSAYKDDQLASTYEDSQVAMDQTANAMLSLKTIVRAQVATTTATTTKKK